MCVGEACQEGVQVGAVAEKVQRSAWQAGRYGGGGVVVCGGGKGEGGGR